MRTKILATTLSLLSLASVSQAGLLKNTSFDLDAIGGANPGTGTNLFYVYNNYNRSGGRSIQGWTITGDSVDVVATAAFKTSDDLGLCVDLIGTPNRSGGNGLGGIEQNVTGLTINQSYTLTFDLGANPESGLNNERALAKTVRIEVFHLNETTPFSTTDFSTSVGADENETNITWDQKSITFTPDTSDVTIKLSAVKPEDTTQTQFYCGPLIHNINLISGADAPAPEPASLAVLGMGALGLLRRRSRH